MIGDAKTGLLRLLRKPMFGDVSRALSGFGNVSLTWMR
jgi:hypothetical protein